MEQTCNIKISTKKLRKKEKGYQCESHLQQEDPVDL